MSNQFYFKICPFGLFKSSWACCLQFTARSMTMILLIWFRSPPPSVPPSPSHDLSLFSPVIPSSSSSLYHNQGSFGNRGRKLYDCIGDVTQGLSLCKNHVFQSNILETCCPIALKFFDSGVSKDSSIDLSTENIGVEFPSNCSINTLRVSFGPGLWLSSSSHSWY